MGKTVSEKILAKSSNKDQVNAGEIIKANADLAMMPDLTTLLAINAMKEMGKDKVWSPEKVVIINDHVSPASTLIAATVHKNIRKFVKEQNIKNFYDVECGVCHQVLPEKGHVKPGMLIVGADSHTCTHGAFGAFATGVGSTDMGGILATGKIWLKVPETMRITINGALPNMVSAKDLILYIVGKIGADGATYKAIEFAGTTVSKLSIPSRMTLCNMAIEMGGKTGIVEPDEKTYEFLKKRTDGVFNPIFADTDAEYEKIFNIDVSNLEPQISFPHKVDNVKPVSEASGIKVDQVFIGSCTNGRYEDLNVAASILENKKTNSDVRLLIVPASLDIYKKALDNGIIHTCIEAGAIIGNPSCGACFGGHIGILAPGEVGLTTSNRNFKGRQGSPEAEIYLCSPSVAAASAIEGEITDPKNLR